MKIGFLAMSGVRAHDEELLRLGLTLPGFVDRNKVIAQLPSLGLLYLAAVTPPGHELRYFEAEKDGSEPAEVYTCELVAISTFSAQIFEAYAIADRLRRCGVRVAIGGLHASVLPEEAAAHADYVITGEAENVWPTVVRIAENKGTGYLYFSDALAGQFANPPVNLPIFGENKGTRYHYISRIFRAADFAPVDVATLPVPRYDLLGDRPYNRFTVQTSRGCPWRCEFCASTVMLSQRYRKRPVEQVIRDIRAISQLRDHPFIEFADDNTFVDKAWGKELCRQLIPLRLKWFTETDLSVANDDQLLGLMRQAGCRQVLIGLESPNASGLDGIELRANAKARWQKNYAAAIRRIQSHGITVNGCFILGLDGHTPDIFDQVLAFAREVPLFEVQITVLTAFPGTPLYTRLLREGRILQPGRWDLCTLFDVNYEPRGMTTKQLRDGLYHLAGELYSAECTEARRRPFFESIRKSGVVA